MLPSRNSHSFSPVTFSNTCLASLKQRSVPACSLQQIRCQNGGNNNGYEPQMFNKSSCVPNTPSMFIRCNVARSVARLGVNPASASCKCSSEFWGKYTYGWSNHRKVLSWDRSDVECHVQQAAKAFQKHFGRRNAGIVLSNISRGISVQLFPSTPCFAAEHRPACTKHLTKYDVQYRRFTRCIAELLLGAHRSGQWHDMFYE